VDSADRHLKTLLAGLLVCLVAKVKHDQIDCIAVNENPEYLHHDFYLENSSTRATSGLHQTVPPGNYELLSLVHEARSLGSMVPFILRRMLSGLSCVHYPRSLTKSVVTVLDRPKS